MSEAFFCALAMFDTDTAAKHVVDNTTKRRHSSVPLIRCISLPSPSMTEMVQRRLRLGRSHVNCAHVPGELPGFARRGIAPLRGPRLGCARSAVLRRLAQLSPAPSISQ